MAETVKRTRGTRKPLITLPAPATEHTEQVANLAALLSNPEGVRLSARVAELEDKLSITQTQLRHAQDELKTAKDLQDRTADELGAAMTEAEKWQGDFSKLKDDHVALVHKSLGLESELKAITEEANTQRKAAGEARAALKMAQSALTHSSESLEQERRAGLVETVLAAIGAAFVAGLAAWLVGRFGR